jgi:hypothetical protein
MKNSRLQKTSKEFEDTHRHDDTTVAIGLTARLLCLHLHHLSAVFTPTGKMDECFYIRLLRSES